MSCDTLPETEPRSKRFRRGDVREDGKIFWCYHKRDGETWFTPEQFIRRKATAKRRAVRPSRRPEKVEERIRRGSVREDGKIFWAYSTACASGERWLPKDRYDYWMEAQRKVAERQRADPDFWEKRRAWAKANKERRKLDDPLFDMKLRFSGALHHAFRRLSLQKNTRSLSVVGLSWRDFAKHIENQFLPEMSWSNRDRWHLDHIVPLALAKTEQDVIDLNHYSNLRPLWAEANLAKGESLPPRELVPAHLLRFIDPSS